MTTVGLSDYHVALANTEEVYHISAVEARTETAWTAIEIEGVVVSLLASLLKQDATDLRGELLAAGSQMPVDSLDLFDVLVEFRQLTGITLPKRKLRRQFMRSVKAFADFASKEGRR